MEFRHAVTTDAGFVLEVGWHLREQLVRNFHFLAPARAFVRGGGAKLTVVWFAAKGTSSGIGLVCW